MRHIPINELKNKACVSRYGPQSKWELRRARLLHWADLIERSERPVQLFHQLEFMPQMFRNKIRDPDSVLAVAFADPTLRSAGLDKDDYGTAVSFFKLSRREAHQLLCDCHYAGGKPTPQAIALRVRSVALRRPLMERVDRLRQIVASWL